MPSVKSTEEKYKNPHKIRIIIPTTITKGKHIILTTNSISAAI